MKTRKINIHIFSQRDDLIELIKKFLGNEKYDVSFTNTDDINYDISKLCSVKIDCLIIDKSIEKKIRDLIKGDFKGIPVICLPSLNEDQKTDNGIKYVQEPLRMSELAKMLDEIFNH